MPGTNFYWTEQLSEVRAGYQGKEEADKWHSLSLSHALASY